jgi:hypothetical protein
LCTSYFITCCLNALPGLEAAEEAERGAEAEERRAGQQRVLRAAEARREEGSEEEAEARREAAEGREEAAGERRAAEEARREAGEGRREAGRRARAVSSAVDDEPSHIESNKYKSSSVLSSVVNPFATERVDVQCKIKIRSLVRLFPLSTFNLSGF